MINSVDVCIPVPLHSSRERNRGFNQSEWFAKGLLKGLQGNIPLFRDVLLRTRKTGTQTKLSKDERMGNLQGAFEVRAGASEKINGKRVLLVDDIVTTGATTESCSVELIRAGCDSVTVFSLARD
ncbi:phosphoribosyltransferase family protein [Chitinispirillales bacterium ANBcel5]|uniref:ComF family protein n=1 Tax=Cellulosispirillum alkaliphilum TaxID=3039283 RepID=UPI002A504F2B|nr:phosphoribosyltransferase family protein [Chitinispirillales bacterium ANBcel5]